VTLFFVFILRLVFDIQNFSKAREVFLPVSAVPFVPHHLDMERLQSFCFAPVPARPTGAGKSEEVGAKSSYAVILLNGDSPVGSRVVRRENFKAAFFRRAAS
jgi:hypothetical protein